MQTTSARPARVTPEHLLELWREAERELQMAVPGTEVYKALRASVEQLGRAYRDAVDARIVDAYEDARHLSF